MQDITVALLIYKSTAYLDFVMDSLLTAKNQCSKRIKYLIVANDATDEVKEYLKRPKFNNDMVQCTIHTNADINEWYIQRVYRGYNKCLELCDTDLIYFVNSDMAFTDGYMDSLLKYDTSKYIPTSRLVEAGRMPSLAGLLSKDFGLSPKTFRKKDFDEYALQIKEDKASSGIGAFMPSLFKTDILRKAGGWQHNRIYPGGHIIPGDQITFAILRQNFGITNLMCHNSIVYHTQSGEMNE